MKRTVLILFAAAFVYGCETSSTVTQAPEPVKCQVALEAPPMLDAGGGSGTLAITTQPECAWDVSTGASWISSITPTSGQGTATVSFRVAANDGGSTRDGTIAVNGEQVRVSQRASCRYDIGPSGQNVAPGGATGTITVAASGDCGWTATSNASWIVITAGASGSGNGTVTFSVPANTGAARTGTVTIAGVTSTITQGAVGAPAPPSPPPAGACSYSLSPKNDSAPVLGGTRTVEVKTTNTCTWTASSNASWITVTAGASGSGDGRVGYLVLPNIGGSRSGTLTIAGQTFTVTQAALVCSYSVSPNNLKVESAAGSGSFSVSTSSTCTWTASSNDSWISVTSGASGEGNGTVTVAYSANTGKDRKGTVTVAGRNVTIDQKEEKGKGKEDDLTP